jgi:hypothetical protein
LLRHKPGAWWWPIRIAFGFFFLHVALSHKDLDEKGAKGLQRFEATAFPFVMKLEPQQFKAAMVAGESATAASLLVPGVPPVLGGAALTGFGTSLLGVYLKSPMLRKSEKSIRPNEFGLGIAKDVWMVAAGLTVLLDAIASRRQSANS